MLLPMLLVLFLLLVSFFWIDCQSSLRMIYRLLHKTRMIIIGIILLDTLNNGCLSIVFEEVTQHSQDSKKYNNQKLGNKMEGDTKDSTIHGSKYREIELISKKVKDNVFKRRNWSLHSVKILTLILLLKNLFHKRI